MQCTNCGKNIEDGNALVVSGNAFCNNLCRYSFEKAHGNKSAGVFKEAISKAVEAESKKMSRLFPKIINAETALKTMKDVAMAYYVIGAIFIGLGIFFAKNLLIDGGICLFLGLSLQFFKSRIAAILMCFYSSFTLIITIMNKVQTPQNLSTGGTNIFLAIIILIGSIKAVEAAFKYHNKYKKSVTTEHGAINTDKTAPGA
jgi:hypothetical protein